MDVKPFAKINELVDNIFCINLDRREDRWEEFKPLWDNFGVEVERFSAIDGNTLDLPENFVFDEFHSAASVACALSHCAVLEEAKKRRYKYILVLEDDAQPCSQFDKVFPALYAQLPTKYKLCYLGGTNLDVLEKGPEGADIVNQNVARAHRVKSTVAYCINMEFADHLIKKIKENLYIMAVDELYATIQQEEVLYIFHPRIVHQFESYSDILGRDIYYHWMRDLE